MKVYLVGKVIKQEESGFTWECGGVFDAEEKAVTACHDYNYFVAPLVLNEIAPRETVDFPGSYYPKAKAKED